MSFLLSRAHDRSSNGKRRTSTQKGRPGTAGAALKQPGLDYGSVTVTLRVATNVPFFLSVAVMSAEPTVWPVT